MSFDLVILIVLGALIFIPFVVVPFVVLFMFRMPAHPEFSPIASGGYPVGALEFFNQNTSALEILTGLPMCIAPPLKGLF